MDANGELDAVPRRGKAVDEQEAAEEQQRGTSPGDSRYGLDFELLSGDECSDREVVLAAVKDVGVALKFASEKLRNDREIVLAALSQDFEEMSKRLLIPELDTWDENVWYKQDRLVLQYASQQLRGERELVLQAVAQHPDSLQFASEELRGDPEIVLRAVAQRAESLEFASAELRGDRRVVLAACEKNGRTIKFAAVSMYADREVMLLAASSWAGTLHYASQALREEKGFVLRAIGNCTGLPEHVDNVGIWLNRYMKGPAALELLSERMRSDVEVVQAAVSKDGQELQFAHPLLQANPDIVHMAVKQHGLALAFASKELQADREMLLAALPTFGRALQFASVELRADEEIARKAVEFDGEALMDTHVDVADQLVRDPICFERIIRERPGKAAMVVFKISLLSGRHCYFTHSWDDNMDGKRTMLGHCAGELELSDEQFEDAELLFCDSSQPVPEELPISEWPGVQREALNSLQLLATVSKRRRLLW